MKKKLGLVLLPTAVLFSVPFIECRWRHGTCTTIFWDHPATTVLLAPAWITILVVLAMFRHDPKEKAIVEKEPDGVAPSTPCEVWRIFYDKATQLHIDTDKGMYQLITVFVGASVLVLGWVVGSAQSGLVAPDRIIIVGSLAVVLVGVATLLKHRLRHYNKLREIYLRKLEKQMSGNSHDGPHGFMLKAVRTPLFEASFHDVIDIYYFVYAFVWVVVYMQNAC